MYESTVPAARRLGQLQVLLEHERTWSFLFSRGILANQKLYDVFRGRSRNFLWGYKRALETR